MPSHDTQPPPAGEHGRMASVTHIEAATAKDRDRRSPDLADTVEMPLVAPEPLAADTIVGYFRHGEYCIKVEYVTSTVLWLWARHYDPDFGPLTGFAAYDRLHYTEFGSIACNPCQLRLTYRGLADDPKWMALPPVRQADLMRKALSLYAYITNGDMMNAGDDLVPNPSPEHVVPRIA